MSKKDRITVQRETLSYIERNKAKFISNTKKYDSVPYNPNWKKFESTNIDIVPMDTLEATVLYQEKLKKRFSFLVMANATNPGGGWQTGAPAQEESICRRTNLVPCILASKYPIPEFGCIYIKNIHLIRDTEKNDYTFFKTPYVSNCVLFAAYSNPPTYEINGALRLVQEFRQKTKTKIENMFNAFLENGDTNIILSAFGCGAFFNPPEDMVDIFLEVINSEKYKNRFENIIFAIIKDSWQNNYKVFEQKLKN